MIIDRKVTMYDEILLPSNYCRFFIYGEESNESSNREFEVVEYLFNILKHLLEKYDMFLYYSGDNESVMEIMKLLDIEQYDFFEGKSVLSGFWTIRYPVLFTKINDRDALYKVLCNWTNVVYISEYICIVENQNVYNIKRIFEQYKYDANKMLIEFIPQCECLISTMPCFDTWDSFDVFVKKQLITYFHISNGDMSIATADA